MLERQNKERSKRHHNKTLILKTAELNERDFLIRYLYINEFVDCNLLTA